MRRYWLGATFAFLFALLACFPGVILLNNRWKFLPFIKNGYNSFGIGGYVLRDSTSMQLSFATCAVSLVVAAACTRIAMRNGRLNRQ